jgi:hypothetical protein
VTIHLAFSLDDSTYRMQTGGMTGEHLATLTREELIDLILRLQVRVTELEAELANKNHPSKTSSNSSISSAIFALTVLVTLC